VPFWETSKRREKRQNEEKKEASLTIFASFFHSAKTAKKSLLRQKKGKEKPLFSIST
jgi:hypothetical protein